MLNDLEELADYILTDIQRNPRLVYDASLECQFRTLVIEPCVRLATSRKQLLKGAIIVLDGLDECIDKKMQISILYLLSTRQSLILNDRQFKAALKSVLRPWPSSESIEKLVQQSSGQFIYATTVTKFISSPDHNPDARLQIVLGIRERGGTSPLAGLDVLYSKILSGIQEPERTLKVLGYILAIMKACEGHQLSRSIGNAVVQNQHRHLLVVEQLLFLPQGEAYFALNDLHSLISLSAESESYRHGLKIQFFHHSFHDFLITKERSKHFHIDLTAVHLDIANNCLKFMAQSRFKTKEEHAAWICAFFCWDKHVHETHQLLDLCSFEVSIRRFFSSPQSYLNALDLEKAFHILGLQRDRSAYRVQYVDIL
ncbi:hypothetical protein BDQ17DRAFT_1420756 [Cyathus striatus]|nr:hypothetical protein BDQ17DRAFT_1420756 [Cyathus striatus]